MIISYKLFGNPFVCLFVFVFHSDESQIHIIIQNKEFLIERRLWNFIHVHVLLLQVAASVNQWCLSHEFTMYHIHVCACGLL